MLTEKEFIDKYCDGDPNKYDPVAIAEGRREVITWDQLEIYAAVLPDLEKEAHHQIKKHLGYLPEPAAYIPHEVFIRAVIDRFRKQEITEEKFNEEIARHVQHIRNDDINQGGWIDNMGYYLPKDLERYNSHFAQFKDTAKARLIWLLGYDPGLENSLYGELMLREQCAMDWYVAEMPPTAIDYKAMTVVLYRESVSKYGKEVADTIPVMSF